MDPMKCKCLTWARVCGLGDEGHHPSCPHHPDEMEDLIGRLLKGIDTWAEWEDGIPEHLCADYDAAKALLDDIRAAQGKDGAA